MASAPSVLVAHDSDTIREAVRRLLAEAGYRVTAVADGHGALRELEARPDGMVLDVAIGGVFAFEVLERVRAAALPTKTVLVASVYNRTGYKRRPTSLYGADDYVEQHHIPDSLVPKVARLVGPGEVAPPDPVDDRAELERIQVATEGRMRMRFRSREEALERAARLARLIVADIALYNGDSLANRDEQDARLRLDVEEGRLLFDLRVPVEIRSERDFIGEALAEWYAGAGRA
jgi:CheY-like chemotaxis protein